MAVCRAHRWMMFLCTCDFGGAAKSQKRGAVLTTSQLFFFFTRRTLAPTSSARQPSHGQRSCVNVGTAFSPLTLSILPPFCLYRVFFSRPKRNVPFVCARPLCPTNQFSEDGEDSTIQFGLSSMQVHLQLHVVIVCAQREMKTWVVCIGQGSMVRFFSTGEKTWALLSALEFNIVCFSFKC